MSIGIQGTITKSHGVRPKTKSTKQAPSKAEIIAEAEATRPDLNRDLQPEIGSRPRKVRAPWNTCELGYRLVPFFDLETRTWKDARIGLTPEDLLHPREEDKVVQEDVHWKDLERIRGGLASVLSHIPGARTFSDVGVDWQVHDFEYEHSPDIVQFYNFHQTNTIGMIRVQDWGLDTRFVVEVVSPKRSKVRANDVLHKVIEYHQVGVPQYVVADVKLRRNGDRRIYLVDYRWTVPQFVSEDLDAQGRVRLNLGENIHVCLGVFRDGRHDALALFDGLTGEMIPDIIQSHQLIAQNRLEIQNQRTRAETAEAAALAAQNNAQTITVRAETAEAAALAAQNRMRAMTAQFEAIQALLRQHGIDPPTP